MRLYINFKAYAKMVYYTTAAKGEVSALGRVEQVEDGYVVKDLHLFKQRCSAASTDMDQESLANFLTDLVIEGKDPSKYNFWFHTHASFGVFWSGTDEDNIQRHSVSYPVVSLVMNKRLEFIARYDCVGKREDISEIVVLPTGHNRLWGRCNREVKRKVQNGF